MAQATSCLNIILKVYKEHKIPSAGNTDGEDVIYKVCRNNLYKEFANSTAKFSNLKFKIKFPIWIVLKTYK